LGNNVIENSYDILNYEQAKACLSEDVRRHIHKYEHQIDQMVYQMIHQARYNAIKNVNTELVKLYWGIGKYISDKLLSAEWGDSYYLRFGIKESLRQDYL
jgi:hypothetical protein